MASVYLALQNSWVQTRITNIVATQLSERLNTNISVGKVNIGFFHTLYLEDVLIEDQHQDTLLFSEVISAEIDTLKIRQKHLSIATLSFSENTLNISHDSINRFNFSFLLNAIGDTLSRDTTNLWNIKCNEFDFGDLNISYSDLVSNKRNKLRANNLNLNLSNFVSIADSVSFSLNQLQFKSDKNIEVKNTSAKVDIQGKNIHIEEFNLQTQHSLIQNTRLDLKLYSPSDSINTPFNMSLRIGLSNLALFELGRIIPEIKGMNQRIKLSGLIYGTLEDFKGKSLAIETGNETKAIFDFYINDLLHPEQMYLFLDLKQSETSFTDISNFKLPRSSKQRQINFPESFYHAGLLQFKGNFSGFLSDFVTFGTLESGMGSLSTDILVTPDKEGEIYYRGNVSTSNFELGKLFEQENLGQITFNGSADGNYNKEKNYVSGIFKGNISEIAVNQYTYSNLKFDGVLFEKMFDGLLSINDPNLKFAFLGKLDLNKEIPKFDFDLDLSKALPSKLNLGKTFPDAEFAFKMLANFEGNKIDNLDGLIKVKEGYYKNRNGRLDLGGMELKTTSDKETNSLLFTSEFFDASINGEYHFKTLAYDFQKLIQHFVPSYKLKTIEQGKHNDFDYQINGKDLNRLSALFVPGLELETPFLLYGNINANENDFQLKGSIPSVRYENFLARNIFIGNQNYTPNQFTSKLRIGELFNRNGTKLYNFSIDSKLENDRLDNTISWSNYDELTYSGNIRTQTLFSRPDSANHQQIEIHGKPSRIYIADTLWSIPPFVANIDSIATTIKNLRLTHNNQEIAIDGKLMRGKGDLLNMKLSNIDLTYFDKYFKRNIRLEGIINGSFAIANAFENPAILSNLKIDSLVYKKHFMGDVSLLSQWNHLQSTIDSELLLERNGEQPLRIFGYMKPLTTEMQYYAELDSAPLIILETFMNKSFSDFKGTTSGKVKLGGTFKKIELDGAAKAENAGLTVNVTQVPYSFSDSIYFSKDSLLFRDITVYDDENNTANFDGTIVHTNFNKMAFDLNFKSDKLKALNTTSRDNEQFYGLAYAAGKLDITGPIHATFLNGTATTLPGTDIKISMESESTVEQYDFIEFVNSDAPKKDDFFEEAAKKRNNELDMSFTIEATPEAKVQLIYNSQIGDIIKAQGEGILLFEMDNEGNMALSGNYNPTKGDYLFTLQNVINKRFSIEQGGSITWSGDPYNAIIDLNAVYKLKASIYELTFNNPQVKNPSQRIQVECIIELDDELVNPTIGFDIKFPNADESDKDLLSEFFTTDEDMNKQILSLIVMGKFYTPDYLRGSYEAQNANALGSTASEMFSNQLSNWLSQINSNWDVGFNYRPGNQVTDDEIEVALSTQMFNDRVTLNGNIGNNVNQYGTVNNNSSQIVGDFEMSVKLVQSGKILFKAYNRSNNNLIYETAPYTQGIGLSFKEEYNSIDELFKKLGSIFKKKKR